MIVSPLSKMTIVSPNKSKRTHKIDTITIHCMACNGSIAGIGRAFSNPKKKASSNYGIDSKGMIGCYVPEEFRSWCSSSTSNDDRAITVEVANDGGAPDWHVSGAAISALCDLLTDVCRRNGITELRWKADKSLIGKVDQQNMTVHRWFKNKACPGDYLFNLHGSIAAVVNERLGAPTPAQKNKFGIDISKWQKGMDINKAKSEGVEFAILKIGGSNSGNYEDPCFNEFYTKAKELNIPVGAYYVAGDFTTEEAVKSADHLIELLRGHQFEYPIYYDVERDMLSKTNPSQLTAIVKAFCKRVEAAGYWVGIYASESAFASEMIWSDLSHFCRWVAAWKETKPSNCDMWQFGGETNKIRSNKIAGQVCDQDYCYVDYPSKIKAKGLNGWGKPAPEPIATPVVRKNSKGVNAKLLQKNLNKFGCGLVEDGIFGKASVAALKAWQNKYGLSVDGIYGQQSYAKMQALLK